MKSPVERVRLLEETAETLRAIRDGEVDAVVVCGPDGESIYTLRCVEPPCRAMIEEMAEGVVVLSSHGEVTYANPAFVGMAGSPDILGKAVEQVFDERNVPALRSALRDHSRFDAWLGETPVSVSVKQLAHETGDVICLVVADMTVHVERAKQIAALSSELTLVEQRERQRLAHTLHDHLQQLIVAVRMQLAVARAGQAGPDAFDRAERLLDEAQTTCRDLTMDLSPPVLHQGDVAAALRWLAGQMEQKHGLHVTVDCAPDAADVAEALRVILFVAARELLFNVVKHAGVDSASVRLARQDQMLVLEVADRGKGFDSGAGDVAGGFGLADLRERVTLLGGKLDLESAPGAGTRASVHLPRIS